MKIDNKKAYFEYEILERIEAGLALLGAEVKSLRAGNASLRDSFARVERNEVFLYNCYIAPYPCSLEKPEPRRRRKLLLHRYEIVRLRKKIEEKGLTLVPLSLYFKGSLAKVELALVRGKTRYDKRQTLKKKEAQREIQRASKHRI